MSFLNLLPTSQDISSFDRLAPLDKFSLFEGQEEVKFAFRRQLMALDALDDCLHARVSDRILYVLGDDSLYRMLASANVCLSAESSETGIFHLMLSQTIYRFTAALKFSIDDPAVKQLRINSWGKHLCATRLRKENPRDFEQFRTVAESEIDRNLHTYGQLSVLLRQDIKPNIAREIGELNSTLSIRLAS